MVIVRLMGGLGNQMFQYAAGRSLSFKKDVPLKLDHSFLEKRSEGYTKRNYELGSFNIKADRASEIEIKKYSDQNRYLIKLKSYFPFLSKTMVFNESKGYFDPRFLKLSSDVYLNGHWQDLKYFEQIKEILQEEFRLRSESQEYQRQLRQMRSDCSVSVHIRRGDYVTLPNASAYHGVLGMEYYRNAVSIMRDKIPDTTFFVFSDDPLWCKEHLDLNVPYQLVESNGLTAPEELWLMAQCDHHIIANSSFSWWAAWLLDNGKKMVIAPKEWYKSRSQPVNLVPSYWQRI
jgi:hypothetical protein